MTNDLVDQAEPPLISKLSAAFVAGKRALWLWSKILAPHTYRARVVAVASVMLVALNPVASQVALAAAGPASTTPALAEFTFTSYEEVSIEDALQAAASEGYAEKPLVVTTEMGRPEKELREQERKAREAREAAARRAAARQATQRPAVASSVPAAPAQASATGNTYGYGYCTWWAKTKRADLPNQLGNARSWLGSARSLGLATGSAPQVGAVVVTSESALGHVGYVEAVNGDEIVVSDMNMIGWNKVSKRTMSASAGVIRGYIY